MFLRNRLQQNVILLIAKRKGKEKRKSKERKKNKKSRSEIFTEGRGAVVVIRPNEEQFVVDLQGHHLPTPSVSPSI